MKNERQIMTNGTAAGYPVPQGRYLHNRRCNLLAMSHRRRPSPPLGVGGLRGQLLHSVGMLRSVEMPSAGFSAHSVGMRPTPQRTGCIPTECKDTRAPFFYRSIIPNGINGVALNNRNVGSPNGNVGSPNGNVGSPNGNVGSPNGNVGSPNGNVESPIWNVGSPNGNVESPIWNVGHHNKFFIVNINTLK
jgi:hypothetical protein